jgi:hypothetical protein
MRDSPSPPPLPSLVTGGPFHALMGKARMLGADDLPTWRAAWVVGALAWTSGALLAAVQWWAVGNTDLLAYFLDASPVAHALVALPVMIGMERSANSQLLSLLEYPLRHRLIPATSEAEWRDAVGRADRQSGSALAEAVMLVLAVGNCLWLSTRPELLGIDRWSRLGGTLDGPLSWAGAWMHIAVGAGLVFLLLRWLLRFLVWTLLLWKLSRMPLDLVATHPDRAAGLGFVGNYPTLFVGLVLGFGTPIGAKLLNGAFHGHTTSDELTSVLALWITVVLVVFVCPVLVFAPRIAAFRNAALLELGAVAVRGNRSSVEAVFAPPTAADPSAQAALGALSALNKLHDRVDAIQPVLVTRPTLIYLVTCAALPMLPALATQVPLSRLLDIVAGKIV